MKSRQEIPSKDRWNVETLYPDLKAWEKDFDAFVKMEQKPHWPQLKALQGTFHQGPEKIKETLDLLMSIDRKLSKLFTYAHLRHDEDITNAEYKRAHDLILTVVYAFEQEASWFQPELLALSDKELESAIHSPLLADYQFHLEKIIRIKKHTLTSENEQLIALAAQAMQTSHKAFSAINDADFRFGSIQDSENQERPLSHATYGMFIREQDRSLREKAFRKYHRHYLSYENTLCELLTGQIQNHFFNARSRRYSSCLEAALFPKNIDTSVYLALIQAVNENIPVLHRYMELRKKVLDLPELHLYDVYVPLTSEVEIRMPYQEAEDLVIASVTPLGEEYQDILSQGFKKHGWVDRYENKHKHSGAYSGGCYDSMPYILMNYKDLLRDVFTLSHEAGHSMHSYYSRRHQPYHYSDYPIFLAEVASTFNENLLHHFLIKKCTTPAEKIFLLNEKIEDIRATLFRQTMFAEFELLIHEKVEQGIPLTPTLLKGEYRNLNAKYFGPSVIIDEEIDIEWARIPHFYYNFYVFQYATGISAALALSERVLKGGKGECEEYLTFLKSGCSRYPIETLKKAGIDMTSPTPVKSAIQKFDHWVAELEKLLIR